MLPFTFVFGVFVLWWWTGDIGPLCSSALTTAATTKTAATATATATTAAATKALPIPRIPAADFDPQRQYYHSIKDANGTLWRYETPVIIEHVLSEVRCEQLTDALIAQCGDSDVTLQRQQRTQSTCSVGKKKKKKKTTRPKATTATTTELYTCSLREAIDVVLHQSSHDDAWLAFCEGFLSASSSSQLRALHTQIDEVCEGLFQQKSNTTTESRVVAEDPCWFRTYFPGAAAPTDCVILAGAGATSTLHRDPYEWTGTNLCLDGTKVWRLVAPPLAVAAVDADRKQVPLRLEDLTRVGGDQSEDESPTTKPHCSFVAEIDHYLEAYRLESIAWGGNDNDDDDREPLTLSAGWQSDYSLYANFQPRLSRHEVEHTQEPNDKVDLMSHIAADLERLPPELPNTHHDDVTLYAGVQNVGDLLVIPAHWWHQTYALEASLALASQRCGADRDIERVLQHIWDTATTAHHPRGGVDDEERLQLLASLRSPSSNPQEIVDRLFDYLSSLRDKNI